MKRITLLALCGLLAVAPAAFAHSTLELERRLKRHVCIPPYQEFEMESYRLCGALPDRAECENRVDEENTIIVRYDAWIRHCLGE